MRPPLLAGLLACALLAPAPGAASRPRAHLNSGACLSCHAESLATLPDAPCISCHAGNMDFLEAHEVAGGESGLWVLGAAGGSGILALLVLGIAGFRKIVPVAAALALAALASPGSGDIRNPPMNGARAVAEGFACDLTPIVSPGGDALLFCRRGPDTDGDGLVDLRDGLALFLLLEGEDLPLRITPYDLDVQGSMAAWSPDGSAFAVPLPDLGREPAGVALFDGDGARRGFLACPEGEVLSPAFSPDGSRIAFVEGKGVGVWTPAGNRRAWALEPLKDRTFPRLAGWSPWGGGPLFTRGIAYAALGRGTDGKRMFPSEMPIEEASEGKAVTLTPPGSAPLRRFKAQTVEGGVFYLATGSGSGPGLFFWDGRSETRWSGIAERVHGFSASGSGDCWAWVGEGDGTVALRRFRGPQDSERHGPAMNPSLLVLARSGDGGALFTGTPSGAGRRGLFQGAGGVALGAAGPNAFGISSAGGSVAVVVVDSDSDGDGKTTPWDRATLWIRWRAP